MLTAATDPTEKDFKVSPRYLHTLGIIVDIIDSAVKNQPVGAGRVAQI